MDLRLQRLTALGVDEINDEAAKLGEAIKDYLDILSSRARVMQIARDELIAIRDEFGTPRKTELIDAEIEIEDEALIEREDVAVTVTHAGYIKRTPLAEYRVQGRGGKGRSGMATRDEDFVTSLFVASTHAPMLFFSSTGMAYKMKVWRLPEARISGKGKAMVNLLPLAEGERITTILALPEDEAEWEKLNVVFATRSGDVRRNALSDFVQVNKSGKIAMKLEAGDGIVGVATCTEQDDFLLTTRGGKASAFWVSDVRVFKGRDSTGVRGIKLAVRAMKWSACRCSIIPTPAAPKPAPISNRPTPPAAPPAAKTKRRRGIAEDAEENVEEATLTPERYAALGAREQFVLTMSQTGFGKRTSSYEYRVTGRGGSGIVAIGMGKKNSAVIASFPVEESDDLMLISRCRPDHPRRGLQHFDPGPRRPGRHRFPGG